MSETQPESSRVTGADGGPELDPRVADAEARQRLEEVPELQSMRPMFLIGIGMALVGLAVLLWLLFS